MKEQDEKIALPYFALNAGTYHSQRVATSVLCDVKQCALRKMASSIFENESLKHLKW